MSRGRVGNKLPVFGKSFPFSFHGTFPWAGRCWPDLSPSGRVWNEEWPVFPSECCPNSMARGINMLRNGADVALISNDPEHWRERAAEARALAEKMTDDMGKQAMIEIAEKYDRLALRAIERLAQRPPQSK